MQLQREPGEWGALALYDVYRSRYAKRFTWLRASLFTSQLQHDKILIFTQFAELVIALRDDRLSIVDDEEQAREPQIICSMGLYDPMG
ncbi:MAG: hypothetical protein M3P24_11415 [Gemmatimonadota bacterium]|nr:hypothetical protein [Gemmatimonadota bacterium]